MTLASRLVVLVPTFLLLSCETPTPGALVPDGSGLAFESVTPPVEGGDARVLQEVEAMGDSVYVNVGGVYVSFDKRRTWKALNAAALGFIKDFAFVTPTAGIAQTGLHGLTYIELDTNGIYYLNNEPAWNDWALREDGTLFTVRQVVDPGSLSRGDETARVWLGRRRDFTRDTPWPEVLLPSLPYNERTYVPSVHLGQNGEIYVASYFGLQVSRDDGKSWQRLSVEPTGQGALSWSGVDVFVTRAGTLFVREPGTTYVSYDQGATYAPAVYPGGISNRGSMMKMEEATPGALYFRDLPYRSTDEGRTFEPLFSIARYGFESLPDSIFFRGGEYYFNLRLVSNFVSASPETTLGVLNPHEEGAPGSATDLSHAFPLRGGRYLGLWKHALVTHTPGELEWKLLRQFPGAHFLWKLRDGRLMLQEHAGVRFSADEGASWSEPVAVSKTTPNSVIISSLVETSDRLLVSGEDRSHCDTGAFMESLDGGASWRSVSLGGLVDTNKAAIANSQRYKVGLSAVDREGKLFSLMVDSLAEGRIQ